MVKTTLSRIVALLAVAGILAAHTTIAVTQVSPPPLWIHAQFYPGGEGPPDPWELTIAGCGDAMQQTFVYSTTGKIRNKTISKSFALSRQDLAELISIVKDAKFFDLPEEISETGFDHYATIELRIVMGGQTHYSSFFAPNQKENREALARFWKVWSAVLKKVPSPNRDQDMLFWMRHAHPELVSSAKS
jgi:hypothetical protein